MNVGLQYECVQDYDWDGIEVALASLAVTTAGCVLAISQRDVAAMGLCLAGLAITVYDGYSLEPCNYKICVGDPHATTPIRRVVYQSLSGDDCDPEEETAYWVRPTDRERLISTVVPR